MSEQTTIANLLEDELLEVGPACQTDIIIPCPPAKTACKVSEFSDEIR